MKRTESAAEFNNEIQTYILATLIHLTLKCKWPHSTQQSQLNAASNFKVNTTVEHSQSDCDRTIGHAVLSVSFQSINRQKYSSTTWNIPQATVYSYTALHSTAMISSVAIHLCTHTHTHIHHLPNRSVRWLCVATDSNCTVCQQHNRPQQTATDEVWRTTVNTDSKFSLSQFAVSWCVRFVGITLFQKVILCQLQPCHIINMCVQQVHNKKQSQQQLDK